MGIMVERRSQLCVLRLSPSLQPESLYNQKYVKMIIKGLSIMLAKELGGYGKILYKIQHTKIFC